MNIHILCLNLFIIVFTINPMCITELINFLMNSTGKKSSENQFLKTMFCVYCSLILLIFAINSQVFVIKNPKNMYWYFIAIIIAPIIIIFEFLLVYLIFRIKGKNVGGIEIVSEWKKVKADRAFFTVSIGILEEIIYRLVWFNILVNVLKVNIVICIIISALFYAFNHIPLGKYVFMQKILSGCIFGVIYYLSGNSIIVPIIAHGLQNIIVILKGGE